MVAGGDAALLAASPRKAAPIKEPRRGERNCSIANALSFGPPGLWHIGASPAIFICMLDDLLKDIFVSVCRDMVTSAVDSRLDKLAQTGKLAQDYNCKALVLKAGPLLLLVYFAAILLVGALFVGAYVGGAPPGVFLFFATFVGLAILYFIYLAMVRIYVSDAEIRGPAFLGFPYRAIRWNEIVGVTYSRILKTFIVRDQNGNRIYIPVHLHGIRPAMNKMKARLSRTKYEEAFSEKKSDSIS